MSCQPHSSEHLYPLNLMMACFKRIPRRTNLEVLTNPASYGPTQNTCDCKQNMFGCLKDSHILQSMRVHGQYLLPPFLSLIFFAFIQDALSVAKLWPCHHFLTTADLVFAWCQLALPHCGANLGSSLAEERNDSFHTYSPTSQGTRSFKIPIPESLCLTCLIHTERCKLLNSNFREF